MTIGQGKYDDLCSTVREHTEAKAAIVLIFMGNKGSGFSIQAVGPQFPGVLAALPSMLRGMADDIERDLKAGVMPPVSVKPA